MNVVEYLLTNIYMGLGISADVYAATLSSFSAFASDDYRRKWIRRNTLTHTLFPLIGMYLVVAGISLWRPLESALFAFAAIALGVFLHQLVLAKSGSESAAGEAEEDSTWIVRWLIRQAGRIDVQWALVMAVSIDAISSGFAKAADTRDWPLGLLLLSFPLVGLVVGAGAWAGAQKAKWFLEYMRKRYSEGDVGAIAQRFTRLTLAALLVELLVLGYFFWRSVASALAPFVEVPWVHDRRVAWAISSASCIAIAAIYGSRFVRTAAHASRHHFVSADARD